MRILKDENMTPILSEVASLNLTEKIDNKCKDMKKAFSESQINKISLRKINSFTKMIEPYPLSSKLRFEKRFTIDLTNMSENLEKNDIVNDLKHIPIRERRLDFANSRKRVLLSKDSQKNSERVIRSRTSRYFSQVHRPRFQTLSLRERHLINPHWIPIDVQRALLNLHAKTRANLSKSECVLNRINCNSIQYNSRFPRDTSPIIK